MHLAPWQEETAMSQAPWLVQPNHGEYMGHGARSPEFSALDFLKLCVGECSAGVRRLRKIKREGIGLDQSIGLQKRQNWYLNASSPDKQPTLAWFWCKAVGESLHLLMAYTMSSALYMHIHNSHLREIWLINPKKAKWAFSVCQAQWNLKTHNINT